MPVPDLTMPVNPWMASQHMPGTCIHKPDARTRTRIYQLQPRRLDRRIAIEHASDYVAQPAALGT